MTMARMPDPVRSPRSSLTSIGLPMAIIFLICGIIVGLSLGMAFRAERPSAPPPSDNACAQTTVRAEP